MSKTSTTIEVIILGVASVAVPVLTILESTLKDGHPITAAVALGAATSGIMGLVSFVNQSISRHAQASIEVLPSEVGVQLQPASPVYHGQDANAPDAINNVTEAIRNGTAG